MTVAVHLSPIFNDAQLDSSGNPATGYQLFTYTAGSSTKTTVYKDSTGSTAHTNPIVLNSRGEPPAPIWLPDGTAFKFVYTSDTDTDPPAAAIRSVDNISGVNDPQDTTDEWITSGLTPTYTSGTTFTLAGDQTTAFHVGRRLKSTNTAGTIYSTITVAAYSSLTTITVVSDSGALDSGLSAVSYGIESSASSSSPMPRANAFRVLDNTDPTKKVAISASGISTGTTRTLTVVDQSGTIQLAGKTAIPVNAAAMTPRTTNGAAAGLVETASNKVMISTWDFDKTTSEGVQFAIPMPSSWNEGTVSFVPYWSSAGGTPAETCIFGCRAVAISNDDVLDAAFGTGQTSSDALIATTDLHVGPESSAITIAGTPAASDWVVFEIYRDISDTLNSDARLHAVTIFITVDGTVDA